MRSVIREVTLLMKPKEADGLDTWIEEFW